MPSPFLETTRSIQANNPRIALIILSLIMIALLGWLGWFLFAQLTVYATSTETVLINETTILTNFAPNQTRLQRGQQAWVYFETNAGAVLEPIPALVWQVQFENDQIKVEVRLPFRLAGFSTQSAPQPYQVEIIIDRLSPATMLLRSLN